MKRCIIVYISIFWSTFDIPLHLLHVYTFYMYFLCYIYTRLYNFNPTVKEKGLPSSEEQSFNISCFLEGSDDGVLG
jgi:hypothetical protein